MQKASPPTPPPESGRDTIEADICILGAGPAGIALAIAAAGYGQTVMLVEKHKMGGTSLNYGAVPAVALAAVAARAHAFRSAKPFGIQPIEPAVDRSAVAAHIREIIDASAPNASAERLTGLGVRVISAAARFTDPRTVVAGQHKIVARRFVVATGSAPLISEISGLDRVPYLTTDTIYSCREPIDHLIVVGGGASGLEIAQAQRRLGARVSVVEKNSVLSRFDPELGAVVRERLIAEGVVIVEGTLARAAESGSGRIRLDVTAGEAHSQIEGSHLLIACGRRPGIADLGLKEAKIVTGADGIKVNACLRTSNRRVYAIGDVTGLPHSTQRAQYQAGLLARTLLFRQSARNEPHLIPATIHTDPEFASVGLSEAEARAKTSSIQVLRWPVRENTRALALRAPEGHIKIIADKSGRILGAAIVALGASELIEVWALAVARSLVIEDMAGWVAPYPSMGELSRAASANRSAAATGHALSRRWVKFLAKFG